MCCFSHALTPIPAGEEPAFKGNALNNLFWQQTKLFLTPLLLYAFLLSPSQGQEMRRFWDTLCCLKQESNDPGATVLRGSGCAGQVHKAGVEDCLTVQAACTCLSLQRHMRRGTAFNSSPTLGSGVGTCQLVHLHEECEVLMANTRTKGHGSSSYRIPELQPVAGKPERSTWERTC